jgi:hypothetical protein
LRDRESATTARGRSFNLKEKFGCRSAAYGETVNLFLNY